MTTRTYLRRPDGTLIPFPTQHAPTPTAPPATDLQLDLAELAWRTATDALALGLDTLAGRLFADAVRDLGGPWPALSDDLLAIVADHALSAS